MIYSMLLRVNIHLIVASWERKRSLSGNANLRSTYLACIQVSRTCLNKMNDIHIHGWSKGLWKKSHLDEFSLAGGGTGFSIGKHAKNISLTFLFPSWRRIFFCSESIASIVKERTFETWTPRLRCTPEHSIQMITWKIKCLKDVSRLRLNSS